MKTTSTDENRQCRREIKILWTFIGAAMAIVAIAAQVFHEVPAVSVLVSLMVVIYMIITPMLFIMIRQIPI